MTKLVSLALIAATALAMPTSAEAAEIDPAVVQLWDVIYVADGSVLKGVIVEELPNTSVRILLVGGTSLVVPLANVTRFTKELNPGFAGSVRAPGGAPHGPGRLATSGLRLGVAPGLAYDTISEVSVFHLAARGGWELGYGEWGLTPSVFVDYLPDVGIYGDDGFGITGGLSAAYRASTVSPFVSFGIGTDILRGDVTLATSMAVGVELLVHPSIALTAQGRYNRGAADEYTYTMSFVSFNMGVEYRR